MTRKEIKAQAARFTKCVEWSDEDQCFVGQCPELFGGGVHGQEESKVYADLCDAVEEWIEIIHQDGTRLPEPLNAKKNSAANLSSGWSPPSTADSRPKPSLPAKASTAIALKLSLRREQALANCV